MKSKCCNEKAVTNLEKYHSKEELAYMAKYNPVQTIYYICTKCDSPCDLR